MRLRTPELVALGLAVVAFLLGASAWLSRSVDLGLSLRDVDGTVIVDSVTPDGLAERVGILPGTEVLALRPLDESQLYPAEPAYNPDNPPVGANPEGVVYDRPTLQRPKVALPEPGIEYLSAGQVYRDDQGRLLGWNGPDLYRDVELARLGQGLEPLMAGLLIGVAIWRVLRRGGAGEAWRTAAIPLAVAVAVPLMVVPMGLTGMTFGLAAIFVLPSLALLPFAHVLAGLQPTADRRRGWFMATWMLAAAVIYLTIGRLATNAGGLGDLRYPMLAGIIAIPLLGALLPGRRGASALEDDRDPTARGEIITLGLTPLLALGVWLPSVAGTFLPVFLLWLLMIWLGRQFTIAPIVRYAQRTQQQRDLVVAATEAERARLAADLHDDALQDLISLVRRLDASGDAEGAEMARHVAERLRAICSDLRLPLLDDLGAGAALEWLVTRVEPLAGGEVRLERGDAGRPPANVELAVFRVAQEAVSNAVRHGRPPITVRYHVTHGGRVSLSVEDAGPGIDLERAESTQQAGHFGLANMQQRAEQIGALLDVRRWPGGGTRVGLEWRPR
jgi:signal transduction histidine kinase